MRATEWNDGPKSVLGRALALLTAFRRGETELSMSELARRAGVPKSTAARLLRELERWGMVERTDTGIRLGLRLFELGSDVPRQRGLQETAAPFLAELFEATHETVHLAVPNGTDVVYLHKFAVRGGPLMPSLVGGRMPAYCTGVGKAILAFAPSARVDAVIAAGMPRRAPRTMSAPGLLHQELAAIRDRGVALEHEESTVGITCVAAPVRDARGVAVAAVSISGWVNRLTPAQVAPAVRTAARRISRALESG